MKKEYILFFAVGLFILAYVLDSVVDPLSITLVTPYHYFTTGIFSQYAFTTTSIVIKAIALLSSIVVLLSYTEINRFVKSGILLGLSGLMQLYALQDVATKSQMLPLEWSLSFALAGLLLLIPMVMYILLGIIGGAHKRLEESMYGIQEEQEEISENLTK